MVTLSAPEAQEVHTPPCFWQKVQVQARAGISLGSGRQSSVNEMLPQWHLPVISTACSLAPALVCEDHRRLNLAGRNRPIATQQSLLFRGRDQREAVSLV